jgi:hypothetical protein
MNIYIYYSSSLLPCMYSLEFATIRRCTVASARDAYISQRPTVYLWKFNQILRYSLRPVCKLRFCQANEKIQVVSTSTWPNSSLLSDLSDYKSPGLGNLHLTVLKEFREVITSTNYFWNIVELRNFTYRLEIRNYNRPISLTCVVCKILESIIRKKLVKHFTGNNIGHSVIDSTDP